MLRFVGGFFISVVLFLALVITLVVWILTPERLTPLIEKYGSEYLTADVRLGRAELTFWSSFPHFEVDLTNLNLVSRTLDTLTADQRAQLPQAADSLLSVKTFHGGINMLKLLATEIALYDVTIDHPEVNLVAYNDSINNYSIVPPSEKEEPDTTPVKLPDISINRFAITGGAPIRYFSLADSIDAGVSVNAIELAGEEAPVYMLDLSGLASAKIDPHLEIDRLKFALNGGLHWSPSAPFDIKLEQFTIGAGLLNAVLDATASLDGTPTISALTMRLEKFRVIDAINTIPAYYRNAFTGFKTDLEMEASMELRQPYQPTVSSIPVAHILVNVPDGTASYQELQLSKMALTAAIDLAGDDIDKAIIDIKRLTAIGHGVGFNLDASLTRLKSDPSVVGTFKGGVSFAKLPGKLMATLPMKISGELRGEFGFDLRSSYLTPNDFHRIKLNGDATLSDLHLVEPQEGMTIYSRLMEMKLGTANSYVNNDMHSDSLLTASLKIDTIAMELPGMTLTSADMLAGVGIKNVAASARRGVINPIGAVMKLGRLTFNSETDTMTVKLRELSCHASLQRYEDMDRVPLLTMAIDADRARYKDRYNRVSFRETTIEATCHPRLKPEMSARMSAKYDSIRAAHPGLRADSIYSLTRAEMRRNRPAKARRATSDGTETIDYGLDNDTKNLLRWINFSASLKARKARLFTPYFPVKNRLSNVDLHITPDSLTLRNTRYEMGRSDFLINGTVTNISRALTSRRQPINIAFNLDSDTIDVNEIAEAAFNGAAFADKVARGMEFNLGDSENDEMMQTVVEAAAASDEMTPLLIPMNVEATLNIKSKTIIYSDLEFSNFRGAALMREGLLNLHQLECDTDLGGLSLTALYTAPTKDDLSFAFGMEIRDLYLEKVMQLMPALDTLMPLLQSVKGIVNADIAATSKVDSAMNLDIPSLSAAVKITGDSLVLLDDETFRTIGKWMLFKNKKRNMVNHMEVQLMVENSMLEIFPFIFTIDRYKLGVMGSNDLAMNFNYHISVLKSPIPFKFGINVKGNPDKMKIRLGGAKFKENMAIERITIVDTTRINLINNIENVFRRGVRNARVRKLDVGRHPDRLNINGNNDDSGDTISHEDSLLFIREGLIEAPPPPPATTNHQHV